MKTPLVYWLLLSVTYFFIPQNVNATHILGGEISVSCKDNGDSLTLKTILYRSCAGIKLNDTLRVNARSLGSCRYIKSLILVNKSVRDITTSAYCSPKSTCSGGTFAPGIEEHIFESTFPKDSFYCDSIEFSFTECCRDNNITTGSAGQNFFIYTNYYQTAGCHNTPSIIDAPPFILINGLDYIISMGDHPIQEDSSELEYSLVNPLQAKGSSTTWASGYSNVKPLKFFGWPNEKQMFPRGFSLDSSTGIMQFRPIQDEFTVYAIKIRKFRWVNEQKVLISETLRDHSFYIVTKGGNTNPKLTSIGYVTVCPGGSYSYTVSSADLDMGDTVKVQVLSSYPWLTADYSDSSKTPKVKITITPTINDRPGEYIVYVKATDNNCPIPGYTVKSTKIRIPHIAPITASPRISVDTFCNQLIVNIDTVIYPYVSDLTYIWRYGPNNRYFSPHKNAKGGIADTGWVKVTLRIYNEYSCLAYIWTDSIYMPGVGLKASGASRSLTLCPFETVYLKPLVNGGFPPYTTYWTKQNQYADSILITAGDTITRYYYQVTDSKGCTWIDSITILVRKVTNAGPNITLCDTIGGPLALKSSSKQYWSGKGINLSNQQYFFNPANAGYGVHTVYLTDTASTGCNTTDSILITIKYPVDAGPNIRLCDTTSGPVNLNIITGQFWTGPGVYLDNQNYFFNPVLAGYGAHQLYKTDTLSAGCMGTDSMTILISDTLQAGQDMLLCDTSEASIILPATQWQFWSGPGVYDKNQVFYFDPSLAGYGVHTIYKSDTAAIGCTLTDSILINVKKPTAAGNDIILCDTLGKALLLPSNTGEFWTGTGVYEQQQQFFFEPRTAGYGLFTIYKSDTAVSQCISSDSISILIKRPIDAGADLLVCNNASGLQPLLTSTGQFWTGTGVTTINQQFFFDPATVLPGTYSLFKIDSTGGGCWLKDSILVTIKQPLNAGPDIKLCDTTGGTVALTTGTGQFWAGTGVSLVNQQFIFDPSLAGFGTHPLYLTDTATSGCTFTDSILILIRNAIDAGPDISICDTTGGSIALATTTKQYWSGKGVYKVNQSYFFNPIAAGYGKHFIYQTDTSSVGCSGTDSILISILPPPEIAVYASIDSTLNPPAYKFSNSAPASGYVYQWRFDIPADGTLPAVQHNSTDSILQFVQEKRAPYYGQLRVLVTDTVSGCTDSSSTVIPLAAYVFASLAEPGANNYRLYPNPSRHTMLLETPDVPLQLELYDQVGKLIWQQSAKAAQHRIERAGLSSGLYFLRIYTTDGDQLVHLPLIWE